MDFTDCRDKLLAIANTIEKAFPGRKKFDPYTRKPLPFEGISVIHNIDSVESQRIGLGELSRSIENKFASSNLLSKVAFVNHESFHTTTFDLINQSRYRSVLISAGFKYNQVRDGVKRAALEFLSDSRTQLNEVVEIKAIDMFCPRVIKLNLSLEKESAHRFQVFRQSLHKHLIENVEGYSIMRGPDWNRPIAAHITLGYPLNPMTKKEVDKFLSIFEVLNKDFRPIKFNLTQGEVMSFTDMNNYQLVKQ